MPHCDGTLQNACKSGETACVSRKEESLYRKPTCFPLGDIPIDTLEVPPEAWVLGARQLQASGVPCVSGVTVMHILKLSLLIDALTGVGFGTGRCAWLAMPTGSTKEGNVGVSGRQWGQTVPRAFSKATGWPQTDAPAITLPGPRSPAEGGVTAQRGRGAGCPSEAGTGPWKPGQAMPQAPLPSTDSACVHTATLPAWWPGGLVSGMVEDSVARMFRPILRPHH